MLIVLQKTKSHITENYNSNYTKNVIVLQLHYTTQHYLFCSIPYVHNVDKTSYLYV